MKRLLVCLLALLFSISFLIAQTDTRGLKVILHSQAGKRWAICIGINNYTDNKLNSLKNAVNDAYGLSAVLKEQGDFNVFTFTDCNEKGNPKAVNDKFLPTKRGIEDFLSNIVSFKDIQSNDLVVFSFSGHGISDAKGNNYLLPFDWNDVKPYESAITVSHITEFLKSLGVTKSLFLIDACREEMSASRSIDNMKRLYEEKFQSAVVSAVFYATKQGGFSFEDPQSKYGAFSRFLIEGLRGKGDQDKDGLVTFRDLSTYVESGLSSWAIENGYKQRPYTRFLVEQSGDLALTIAGVNTPHREQPPQTQTITSTEPTPFSNKKDADFAPEMVYIPAGEFMMGSNDLDIAKPVHRVKVDAFYIGKYEVTQREWIAVMGSNPSNFEGDDLPVEKVSWIVVLGYLQKLSNLTGKRWRLPTEAEWEYACRAGSTTMYCFGDNAKQLGEYAWYKNNSDNKTHPVGQKKPNAWGLYDMHGNVWEWCHDWYDKNYYANSLLTNPTGPSMGSDRVCRGGGWFYDGLARYLRSAYRGNIDPGSEFGSVGFRCLQEP